MRRKKPEGPIHCQVTRKEAFANAARALFYLIVELETIEPRETVSVQAQGSDAESVLVNWLGELLFLHDAEGWLFRDFEIVEFQDHSVTALAYGERFQAGRHQTKALVKAITYHQLALEKTPQGWRAQVYVDI